jgi:hypothetical protein
MLSDACSDFVGRRKEKKSVAQDVARLARDIEHYSQEPYDYPAYQLDALRLAVRHVLANPDDDVAVRWLSLLADCVREYHDSPPMRS